MQPTKKANKCIFGPTIESPNWMHKFGQLLQSFLCERKLLEIKKKVNLHDVNELHNFDAAQTLRNI